MTVVTLKIIYILQNSKSVLKIELDLANYLILEQIESRLMAGLLETIRIGKMYLAVLN